jgi:predicted ester cyclase
MTQTVSASPPEAVRAYVAAFNAGDWEAIRPLFTEAPMIRGVLGWGGLDVALPIWRELHEGLQMRLGIEALAHDGDTVVARFTETGRFVGPFRGLPSLSPTGRTYEIVAMEWFEFEGGRIARRWGARDSATITRMVTEA